MIKSAKDPSTWEARNKKHTILLACWTGGWLATTAILAFGPKFIWHFNTLATILSLLVNLGVGFGMILAFIRHLKGLDEMHQKIILEAAALSLGVGLVCSSSYKLLEDIKLISFEPEIFHLVILMSLTFLVGVIAGHRKYQ